MALRLKIPYDEDTVTIDRGEVMLSKSNLPILR